MKRILVIILIIMFMTTCVVVDKYANQEKYNLSTPNVGVEPVEYVDAIIDLISTITLYIIAPAIFIIGIIKVLRKKEGQKYIINSMILFSIFLIIQVLSQLNNPF